MGKEITLPTGMTISEVSSIGQYVSLGGSTYDTTDIKMSEIRNVLGESTYDLSLLCTSANINKWAAFKPHGGSGAHESGMALDAGEIVYQPPTFEYRMGDFAGYNHSARVPGEKTQTQLFTYTATETKSWTEFIRLPEFDLREIDSNIQGVISEVSGYDNVFTELTNYWMNEREMGFDFDLDCNIANATSSINISVKLGYDNGVDIISVADFPHAGTGELIITATAYNMSIPTLSAYFEPGDGGISDTVYCTWNNRDTTVLDRFELFRRDKVDGAGSYGSWSLLYSGTTEGWEDETVEVPISGTNYYEYKVDVYWEADAKTSSGVNDGTTNIVEVAVPSS